MRNICFLALLLLSACQAAADNFGQPSLISEGHQGPSEDRGGYSNDNAPRDGHW
jgi:hypothetical protein